MSVGLVNNNDSKEAASSRHMHLLSESKNHITLHSNAMSSSIEYMYTCAFVLTNLLQARPCSASTALQIASIEQDGVTTSIYILKSRRARRKKNAASRLFELGVGEPQVWVVQVVSGGPCAQLYAPCSPLSAPSPLLLRCAYLSHKLAIYYILYI